MKPANLILILALIISLNIGASAQKRGAHNPQRNAPPTPRRVKEIGSFAVVMDETLSVLREKPSLFADSIQRMRRGRRVLIQGIAEADGVKFYRVAAPPSNTGWVQSDAVFGKFREDDDARLARLVQASSGFDQIELATAFFELYPQSKFRAPLLLSYGDILEEAAAKLTKEAGSKLDRREMAASAAPMHSYYLNFVMLDRYHKLGILFLFDSTTRAFHYNGSSWRELTQKFPTSAESAEAQKRLDSLKVKMEHTGAAGR